MADHARHFRRRTAFSPCSQGGAGQDPALPGLRVYRAERYSSPMPTDIVLVHSSDLHVDEDRAAAHGGDGAAALRSVLATARGVHADILLLAGDTFENNQ